MKVLIILIVILNVFTQSFERANADDESSGAASQCGSQSTDWDECNDCVVDIYGTADLVGSACGHLE